MLPAPDDTAASRNAFTLIEVALAIFLAVMIMMAAVPSVSGLLEQRRAEKQFNEFDGLAKEASSRAVSERRPYVIEWDDTGVTLHPLSPGDSDNADQTKRVEFGEKMVPDLIMPGALVKKPAPVWTFWPTGTCEPVKIVCHVPDAPWTATYDALTEQPVYTSP